MAVLIDDWFEFHKSPSRDIYSKYFILLISNDFSPARVDESLSKYLVTVPQNNFGLVDKLRNLQARVRTAFK
jgi:hypothetical protein